MKKEIGVLDKDIYYITFTSINKPELKRFRKLVDEKECSYIIDGVKKSDEKVESITFITKNITYFSVLFKKFYTGRQLFIGKFTFMGKDVKNKYGEEFYCYAISKAEAFNKLVRQVSDVLKMYNVNFYYNYFKCRGTTYTIYTMKNRER